MPGVNSDESDLLQTWEEIYKRGLLTFWLLLLLAERPSYAYEMNSAVRDLSHETISVNEQSIYRALTRFEGMGLVTGVTGPSQIGPPRKYYHLTPKGRRLLARFIKRNLHIFQEPEMVKRLQDVTANESSEEMTP
jgi:PadR family transcriptional regulator, regulatory protein PadR